MTVLVITGFVSRAMFFREQSTSPLSMASLFGPLLILAGVFGLGHAAKMQNLAKRLAQSSFTSIAGVTPGLHRVRGFAKTTSPLQSPFTQTSCCCYRIEVEQSYDDLTSNSSGWRTIHAAVSNAPFYVKDATGSLQIWPEGLVVDLPFVFQQEVITKPRNAHEQALVDYVARNCPNQFNRFVFEITKRALISPEQAEGQLLQERLQKLEQHAHRALHKRTTNQSFRFQEVSVLPDWECEITGTVITEGTSPVMVKGPAGEPFLLSVQSSAVVVSEKRNQAFNFGLCSAAVLVIGILLAIFNF